MKVGEFCNREVVFIGPGESVLDAAKLMRAKHVGDVVVAEQQDGRLVPIGIVTDRDLAIEILAREADPKAVTAGDLADPDALLTAQSDDGLLDTLERMRSRGVRRIPVMDRDGTLAGILTMDDVLELISEQLDDLVNLMTRERQRETALRTD